MKRLLLAAALALAACEDPFAAEQVRLYKSVATGGEHSCAVATDGSAWCWGKGTDGELGIGIKENRFTPARVNGNIQFTEITAGDAHSCGIAVDGSAYCWGFNGYWQRGNATDPRDAEPVPASTSVKFRSITAGAHHNCALSVDSLAYCWGNNQYGQLGDGSRRTRAQPMPASGNLRFAQLSAGAWHSCGVTAGGAAYCWGRNQYGQLGTGTGASVHTTPTAVGAAVTFRQIDGGATHTCAVATDTRFFCWGGAEYGELGTGGATPPGVIGAPVPQPISQLFPNGLLISAGEHHTCAVGLNGNARCWGRGTYGQLASGATATHYHPQPVFLQPGALHLNDLFVVSALATGGRTHACALADERVYCWGTGDAGQLGVAGSRFALMPQRVQD